MNQLLMNPDEEEFYSDAQSLILIYALFAAKEKFLRNGYEIPNRRMKTYNIPDNILTIFDNDTEIFYTALNEGHSYVNNIRTEYPKNLEKMGERLFMLCKNEFKQIVRQLELKR